MTVQLPSLRVSSRAVTLLAMLAVGLAVLLAGALPASAQPQQVPDSPDKPSGKAINSGIVYLEWNDLPDATSYDVQFYWHGAWHDLPGNGIDIAFYGAGAILRNLPEEGVYYFQVRARNAPGGRRTGQIIFSCQAPLPKTGMTCPSQPTRRRPARRRSAGLRRCARRWRRTRFGHRGRGRA